MITINWIIERLLVRKVEGTYSDVVITADWRCNGTQDQYSGTCYGSASFAPPSGSSFTPYEDLTQEQVLSWCFASGVDKTAIEANVSGADGFGAVAPPVGGDDDIGESAFGRADEKAFDDPVDGGHGGMD